ncbi:MAG: sugar phosphate isomerase/epimerase [Clostridiales bacterium]|nr:sugar phosphate isomerase/epimerase [Clostridiales bacterium]
MKLGICCSVEQAPTAKKLGYDYWELNVRELAQMEDGAFEAYRQRVLDTGLAAEAGNCFFPAEIRVTGEAADLQAISAFARKALQRAASLGVKTVVFGSGDARRVDEGFSYERAYGQFIEALKIVGDIAGEYDIMIAVEPLRKQEDNLINRVPQGLAAAKEANNAHVAGLADLYHMKSEGESFADIGTYGAELVHIHIAAADRTYPTWGDGQDADYALFAKALKACRYQGRISIEAGTQNFEADAEKSLALLKTFCYEN